LLVDIPLVAGGRAVDHHLHACTVALVGRGWFSVAKAAEGGERAFAGVGQGAGVLLCSGDLSVTEAFLHTTMSVPPARSHDAWAARRLWKVTMQPRSAAVMAGIQTLLRKLLRDLPCLR
jgi:hypothetical protein